MSDVKFKEFFGTDPEFEVKAPGRTELGGNHTDHQRGRVLAAPVDLYATAYVSKNEDHLINIKSEGYDPFTVDLRDTSVHPEEYGTTYSLVRGVANAFTEYGLTGFNAYITSEILPGSGLSSSAAMEILFGRICCALTGAKKSGEELAILGQYVENVYFGKPCGLMDQMACAADGIISIDFEDPSKPKTEYVHFDFQKFGYSLCIINSGAGHENLTENYADVTRELAEVCAIFGKSVLREIPEEDFYARLKEIREKCGDRAALRAMHFYDENNRVPKQIEALRNGDMERFLALVDESGRSSWEYLQNVIPEGSSRHQEMALALALARKALNGRGVARVHGGGFAGTLQVYVPNDAKEAFTRAMEAVLGEGCCSFVKAG